MQGRTAAAGPRPARGFPGDVRFFFDDTKARKYSSLIPALLARGVREVRLEGSANSTNVLRLALALKSVGIRPYFLPPARDRSPVGNNPWIRMVLGEDYGRCPEGVEPIPEGAACPEAWPGAVTLGQDLSPHLDGIDLVVIDAGTGFTAAGLIAGLTRRVKVAVLELARPCLWRSWLPPGPMVEIEVWEPSTARSFGAVNAAVRAEQVRMAREEGILVDLLYGAKLCRETRLRVGDRRTVVILTEPSVGVTPAPVAEKPPLS